MKASKDSTSTRAFGTGRWEGHDASAFYARFTSPEISTDTTINPVPPDVVDKIYVQDARDMSQIPDNSIALVVTSPPYFVGKEYETSDGAPDTYAEYIDLLYDVFTECYRVLEPGGRIAVNVANLGRKPHRSLSGTVTTLLESLDFLPRGEIIWLKGRAAGSSCAWGTFQSPANPVLHDVTERIITASKGRFDRALTSTQRAALGLPSVATISRDEFIEATTDIWEINPASATRVGHPAPFPTALPRRLIELYTYEGDVVLDPFIGSGSTAIAAVQTGRHFVGFDTDERYVADAQERATIFQERATTSAPHIHSPEPDRVTGDSVKKVARDALEAAGFTNIRAKVKVTGQPGITLSFLATSQAGEEYAFDIAGALTNSLTGAGLRSAPALWKAIGKASVLHTTGYPAPLILLTTSAPAKGTPEYKALEAVRGPGKPVRDVIVLGTPDEGRLRL